jgi:hypothetical protein
MAAPAGLQGNDIGLRKEFLAFLRLLRKLRQDAPDLFINATVGTFSSPFWLWYADSIWRGGNDCDQCGDGTPRERWTTYRDAQVYRNVVKPAPYFPLSSLMLHGIVYAIRGQAAGLGYSPESFRHEVRSYFATGTRLQELHVTSSLLSDTDWDVLAETAIWARQRTALFANSFIAAKRTRTSRFSSEAEATRCGSAAGPSLAARSATANCGLIARISP